MTMNDGFALQGAFHGCLYQHNRVLRALESGDPEELVWAMRQIKQGSMEGFEQVSAFEFANTVVNEYRDRLLQLGIGAGTVISTIVMGLFDNDVTPGATTTLAGLDSAVNEFEGYTVSGGNSTNRAPFTAGTAASQSIDNSASPSRFTFTATGTIRGAFVVLGSQLKGSQPGNQDDTAPNILAAIGRLSADQPIAAAGAIIDMTYTQTAS